MIFSERARRITVLLPRGSRDHLRFTVQPLPRKYPKAT